MRWFVYNSATAPPLAAFPQNAWELQLHCQLNKLLSTPIQVNVASLYLDVSLAAAPPNIHTSPSSLLPMLCLPSCLLLSHLSSIFLPPTSIARSHSLLLVYLFHSRRRPRCPCVFSRSLETDSLKNLLWNLLCDDNSRPFPCRTGKTVKTTFCVSYFFREERENKPLKLFFCEL